MNYVSTIVKILDEPKQTKFNDKAIVIKVGGEIPKLKNDQLKSFIKLNIWLLTKDFSYDFCIGDFLIVEGFIYFRFDNFNQKYVEISVYKFKNLSTLI